MTPIKSFSLHTLQLGPMDNFVYLIVDIHTRRAAVVDPAWEVPRIVHTVKSLNVTVTDILLTHSHFDHINGLNELLKHYDAQVHLTRAEARFWASNLLAPSLQNGGDIISLGTTPIKVLHTPGHTPGSACYHVGDYLIAGDTLFVYGCGRCDLAGGDPNAMFDTLRKLRSELPTNTITLPGHNYSVVPSCTLADQISGNPFLHLQNKDQFVDFRMHKHDSWREKPYRPVMESEVTHLF